MPDLDLIKQEEQGSGTSDFDSRPEELEDTSKARAAAGIAESGSPWLYNR